MNRPLRVFLCHSSNDKPAVRELYQKLRAETWIQPWLDEEELYPGQDWNIEIEKAIEETDVIIVCLSNNSITKEGYVQKEIKTALDYSDYKPEGTVFIIPVRLEDCKPPIRLSKWQYEDYFGDKRDRSLKRLLVSLKRRADSLGLRSDLEEIEFVIKGIKYVGRKRVEPQSVIEAPKSAQGVGLSDNLTLSNGMEFMRVPAGKFLMGSNNGEKNEKPQHTVDIPYDYWMARFPITNRQYNVYVKSKWFMSHPVSDWEKKTGHPVTYIKWTDINPYCQWLNNLLKVELPSDLVLRLPTEAEWEKAVRGTDGREYPWGKEFNESKCNSSEGDKKDTTHVGLYSPDGDSPFGCADMAGNVWEWTHSLEMEYPYNTNDGREGEKASGYRVLRGGSFDDNQMVVRCAHRLDFSIDYFYNNFGFRIALAPPVPD